MISLVLIEDNHSYTEALRKVLDDLSRYRLLGVFDKAEDFVSSRLEPDIIIVDLDLKGMSGIRFIARYSSEYPRSRMIVNTVMDREETVFECLREGAVGYITKSDGIRQMTEVIDTAMQGGAPMSMRIARMVISSFQRNKNSPLTERETEVLRLLSDGRTYRGIADAIHVSRETVKTHLKNIYVKLQVESKEEALRVAREKKYY